MDDIIEEFIIETNESLEELDMALIDLEQNPEDEVLIGKIFRFIHTIKGTCGFLGLSRLEYVAHHGEDVLSLFRDKKLNVTPQYISTILACIDRIKYIVMQIQETGNEPEGDDSELVQELDEVCSHAQGRTPVASPVAPETQQIEAENEIDPALLEDAMRHDATVATEDNNIAHPTPENPNGGLPDIEAIDRMIAERAAQQQSEPLKAQGEDIANGKETNDLPEIKGIVWPEGMGSNMEAKAAPQSVTQPVNAVKINNLPIQASNSSGAPIQVQVGNSKTSPSEKTNQLPPTATHSTPPVAGNGTNNEAHEVGSHENLKIMRDAQGNIITINQKREISETADQAVAGVSINKSGSTQSEVGNENNYAKEANDFNIESSLVFTRNVTKKQAREETSVSGAGLDVGDIMAKQAQQANASDAPTDTTAPKPAAAAAPTPKATTGAGVAGGGSAGKQPPRAAATGGGGSSAPPQTLRVNVEVLEGLMTTVSELVLTRNQLLQTARKFEDNELLAPLQRLNFVVSELQEGVMKTRMQPIGNAWSKLPRIVRDTSIELGKKVELEMSGQDTELDRQVLEMIKDPLTHMVRNSVDHGVEMPDERVAAGKSEVGHIYLRSFHQGGHIIIEIADDGKGLSLDILRKKIISKNLASEEQVEQMSAQQVQQYIFNAGFSTADKVSAISGRGVGMDVVRTNIEQIGGSIELSSTEGRGTSFRIKIPLTLAIVSALIIGVANERFAIPQLTVRELVMVGSDTGSEIEHVNNVPLLRLRNHLLPLVSLSKMLGLSDEDIDPTKDNYVIVSNVGSFQFGVLVDHVYDMEEIVIKPVSRSLKKLALFSGNTILGDGQVIMILDPTGILKTAGLDNALKIAVEANLGRDEEERIETRKGKEERLLLFSVGEDENVKAVPLTMISRLEEINMNRVEMTGGRMVIQQDGKLLPIYNFNGNLSHSEDDEQKSLIIFNSDRGNAGLIVDRIINITSYFGHLNMEKNQRVFESVIINEHAAEIINPAWFNQ